MKRGIILVGAGNWGRSWLPFIQESQGWELAALVSRGGENLKMAREKFSIPAEKCVATLDDALKGPAEVVLITAPHQYHVPMAVEAMRAGRHALIEKPLSDDFDAARQLVEFAERSAQKAWVVQNFRFRPGLWRLHRSIAAGTLGRLQSIRLLFRIGSKKKAGAPPQEWRRAQWSFLLNEIIIHHFDMARFVAGQDAEWVWCHGWKPSWITTDGPEAASATVGFRGGAVLEFSGRCKALCGPATKFDGQWIVETDRGAASYNGDTVEWDGADGESAELLDDAGFPGFDRGGVLNDLTAALDGRPTAALPTARDNLRSFAMVCAAIRSVKERRRVELAEFL
ncbi:MAG: Gfo/Idh/MocA family oxidoreductase [Candidatus Sumerlaeota bacterium]|nr:Gfo/Idh/MocA family oxidoreductase [Candidatus Sumerlaeota bacterium]